MRPLLKRSRQAWLWIGLLLRRLTALKSVYQVEIWHGVGENVKCKQLHYRFCQQHAYHPHALTWTWWVTRRVSVLRSRYAGLCPVVTSEGAVDAVNWRFSVMLLMRPFLGGRIKCCTSSVCPSWLSSKEESHRNFKLGGNTSNWRSNY